MSPWVRHAFSWSLLVIGGIVGYVLFEYAKHHIIKGLGFATATILIDLGILFISKDLEHWKEES